MRVNRYSTLFALFSLGYLLLAWLTASDYGLSWDEPTRWESGDLKLDYYKRLLAADDRLQVARSAPVDVYPGFYDLTLAMAKELLGMDRIALSRLWNSLFGFFALLAPIVLTRQIMMIESVGVNNRLSTDLLPLVSGVALLLCPSFYGHLFINPKDMPFAATYAWSIVGLLSVLKEMPNPRIRTSVLLGSLIGITMAIRPPGLVLIFYFGLLVAAWFLVVAKNWFQIASFKRLAFNLGQVLLAFVVASLVLFPFWPRAHQDVFGIFTASASGVANLQSFSSTQPVLFGGQFYEAGSTPWYYIVWMFVIKQPEWFVLLILGGGVFALRGSKSIWEKFQSGDKRVWAVCLVTFAFLFPIGFVTLTGSAVHNGFRHMLYVLPMAAVLVGLGWNELWKVSQAVPRRKYGLLSLSAVCVLFSALKLNRLHPYQYIHYNAFVGGVSGAYGNYETEYWFTVGKEGAESLNDWLESTNSTGASLFVMGPSKVVRPYLKDHIRLVGNLAEATYYIGRPTREVLQAGSLIGEVNRSGVPILVLVHLEKQ